MASKLKPLCKFGEKCYRKNPQHLNDYRHPKRKSDEVVLNVASEFLVDLASFSVSLLLNTNNNKYFIILLLLIQILNTNNNKDIIIINSNSRKTCILMFIYFAKKYHIHNKGHTNDLFSSTSYDINFVLATSRGQPAVPKY